MSRVQTVVDYTIRYAIWLAVVAALGQGALAVNTHARKTLADRQPTSNYFEYESVAYNGITEDGNLEMLSTSVWYQTVDRVVWHDTLECETASGSTQFYSSQEFTAAHHGPDPLNVSAWPYTAPWPTDGRPCRMRSTITIEHDHAIKSTVVTSDTFTPWPP